MEAVAAVGVAAAAVQFLDFSTKTLVLCKQIRDSPTGSTEANAELIKSVKQLTEMQKDLKQAGSTPSSTYRQLLRTVQECSLAANDLLQLLEDIRQASRKSFGPMRSAFSAMKGRKTIEKLQKRLADCQERFEVATTLNIRQSVVELLEEQGKSNDLLQNVMLPELKQLSAKSSASHAATHNQLQVFGKNLTDSSNSMQRRLSAIELNQRLTSDTIVHGQSKLESNISRRIGNVSKSAAYNDFCASLHFDDMFARQQSIAPRQTGTYEWVFTGQSPYPKDHYHQKRDEDLRGRFLRWLYSDQPSFWVNGKAGSGKTSLMSFIEGDKRTHKALRVWARNRKLYTFSFFFWRPGSPLQKSIAGLLRTILYQVTKAKPAVISRILSARSSLHYSDWTEAKLLDALKLALAAYHMECVFLLVDGLDEFDGDYNRLLDALTSIHLGSNIKLCVSSRPETAFVRKLANVQSLSLQDLNYYDIEQYATSQLVPYGATGSQLVEDIRDRAEGIFLWAVLVCKSLASGIEAGDDDATMQLRLNAIPSGLKDLFDHMFSNIDDVHRADLSLYFHLLLWKSPISVALVIRLLRKHPYESLQEYQEEGELMGGRILAQSKGLLYIFYEARPLGGWSLKDIATDRSRLQYFDCGKLADSHELTNSNLKWVHRSAYDYISEIAFENTAFRLTPMDNADVIYDMLQAYRWLAQYTPMIHIRHGCGLDNSALSRVVLNIIQLVDKTNDPRLDEDVYHVLDEIYGALHSSIIEDMTSKQSSPTLTALHRERISTITVQWHDDLVLLVLLSGFWSEAYQLEDYLLSRFDTITGGSHGAALCAEILWHIEYMPPRHPNAIVERSSIKAVEYISEICAKRDVAPRAFFGRSSTRIISWAGSGLDGEMLQWLSLCNPDLDLDELLPALGAKAGCGRVLGRDYVAMESRVAVVCDSYQLFIDCGRDICYVSESGWRDLRLLLSWNHFGLGLDAVFPHSFSLPRAVLRLCCSKFPHEQYSGESDLLPIAIYFDLSSHLTTEVMAACCNFSELRIYNEKDPEFSGTSADLANCQQMIIDEIWENANGQLDAWGQLYLLANVKKWFGSYWKIEETTSSDEWLSESDNESGSGVETSVSTVVRSTV